MKASNPGYNFSTADLARASIPSETLGRMIVAPGSVPDSQLPDVSQLLAAILKSQKKNGAKFRPVPFNYATYARQMAVAENPDRQYLLIQNVGSGDLMVVFETGPAAVESLSANAQTQAQLTAMQTRAIRIVAGGYYEPLVTPTNPITLFTLNTATNGLLIEGA